MDQYIVEFKMSGKTFPEHYTVDTRKEAYPVSYTHLRAHETD